MNKIQSPFRFSYYRQSSGSDRYRRVFNAERDKIHEHFMRLDGDDRRTRFCGMVSDSYVSQYSARPRTANDIVLGFYVDDELRGMCELFADNAKPWPDHAEIALSVESPWQNQGIGKKLFHKMTVMARNRGIKSLSVDYENYNRKMNALVMSYNARTLSEEDTRHVRISLSPPSCLSWYEEIAPVSYARSGRLLAPFWQGRT